VRTASRAVEKGANRFVGEAADRATAATVAIENRLADPRPVSIASPSAPNYA
jgi:hypothetical protein